MVLRFGFWFWLSWCVFWFESDWRDQNRLDGVSFWEVVWIVLAVAEILSGSDI